MLDKLIQSPVVLGIIIGWSIYFLWLRIQEKNNPIHASSDAKLAEQLRATETRLPDQEPFDLSVYNPKHQKNLEKLKLEGVSIHNAKVNWEVLPLDERDTLIIYQFDLFQQFINMHINSRFVVQRNNQRYGRLWDYDMPYNAICFDV